MSGILVSEACLDFYKKMAAKTGFWEIGERDFLRDPKKYTFGKLNFKTFYKTRIFEILPPFLSTFNTWMDPDIEIFLSADGGPKKFFYARTLRVLAPLLQIKPISTFICSRIDDRLLRMISQNILQKDILRENGSWLFCSRSALRALAVGPPGLVVGRPSGPSQSALRALEVRSTEAYISGMYYKSILTNWYCEEISRNEWDIDFRGLFWTSTKKWRQFLDFERSGKGIFWKGRKSTLLENSISKPFIKLGFLKFCRHFCLHRIHGLYWFCRKWYR